tara:strand:- start:48862 stop:49032 length:171 start_codon:yes stop_codon:yes gene_type:complete
MKNIQLRLNKYKQFIIPKPKRADSFMESALFLLFIPFLANQSHPKKNHFLVTKNRS